MINNKFSLDDLNELSERLGDRICALLHRHKNWWDYLQAEKEINDLLIANKLSADDVLVNRGLAEGLTIQTAFENASRNYQFHDQFDT